MGICYESCIFFFQAEDGIRDGTVTGVQTCALPISAPPALSPAAARMRAIIAGRMMESLQTTAQLTLTTEVDMEGAVRLRDELKQRVNVRVTYTDLIVRASAIALREHHAVNARWESGGVRRLAEIHIGVAVALEEGLVVPV